MNTHTSLWFVFAHRSKKEKQHLFIYVCAVWGKQNMELYTLVFLFLGTSWRDCHQKQESLTYSFPFAFLCHRLFVFIYVISHHHHHRHRHGIWRLFLVIYPKNYWFSFIYRSNNIFYPNRIGSIHGKITICSGVVYALAKSSE